MLMIVPEEQDFIKVSLMAIAYTEYKDEHKKDEVVKSGIRVGLDTADFRSGINVKDKTIWETLIKESYINKITDTYKDTLELGVNDLTEDISQLTLFKDAGFSKEVNSAYERLSRTPVRLLMGKGDLGSRHDRQRFKQATEIFYGEGVEPNFGDTELFSSPTISIKDYKSILELEPITLANMIDLKYLEEGLEEEELGKLDNAIFNYILGKIGQDSALLNKDFIRFKEDYEGLLAQGLNLNLDVKLMTYSTEDLVTLEELVEPIVVLNEIVSEGLDRGVLDYEGLEVGSDGDIVVKDLGDKLIKLKVFEMHEYDTYIRISYENDKRKKKYGKIKDVKSYSVGEGNTLIESNDDYLKYLNKI